MTDISQLTITFDCRVRHGRMHSMMQQLIAQVRRAPKRERDAIASRGMRAIAEACLDIRVGDVSPPSEAERMVIADLKSAVASDIGPFKLKRLDLGAPAP